MVAGTLLLTESVNRSFDELFTEVNEGIDVTVRSRVAVEGEFGEAPVPAFDASVLRKVRATEGVDAAEGVIADSTITILGEDGERIGPPQGGPPHIAPLAGGGGPVRPVDRGRGRESHRAAGGRDRQRGRRGRGIRDRRPGAHHRRRRRASDYTHLRDHRVRLRRLAARGQLRAVHAAGSPAADEQGRPVRRDRRRRERGHVAGAACARRSSRRVGPKLDVRTGAETAEEDAGDIQEGFGFLSTALLVFAGIAVFVGGFLIFNTFSITVAQRVREFAMLRTLGASARQVLTAVLLEAALIGLLASALGIAGGFGFVELIKGLFESFGFTLPVTEPATDTAGRRHPGSGGGRRDAGLGAGAGAASDAGRPARGSARERRLPGGGGASQQEAGDHRRRPGRAGRGPDRAGAVRNQRDRRRPSPSSAAASC